MGIADVIVDLVSSGTTLRENNLKEIEGGVVLESQVNSLVLFHPANHAIIFIETFLNKSSELGEAVSCIFQYGPKTLKCPLSLMDFVRGMFRRLSLLQAEKL